MPEHSVPELRSQSPLPDTPSYRALTRVLSSKLAMSAVIIALLATVFGFVSTFLNMRDYAPLLQQNSVSADELNNPMLGTIVEGIWNAMIVFLTVITVGYAVLQITPQLLLLSRARRAKPLGSKPFTVLRTLCIVLFAVIVFDLFFAMILFSALTANYLSYLTLAISALATLFLARLLGSLREIAVWGKASKPVPCKITAFFVAIQIIANISALVPTVLQYINPAYFKLDAYTCDSLPRFLLAIGLSVLGIAQNALYALAILRLDRELPAAAQEAPTL